MTELFNPNDDTRIAADSQVALHFSVSLENGVQIDNTRDERGDDTPPVSLVMGDGSLLPGFEQSLLGLRAGDRRTVHLPSEDAFGPWNPENVQTFDRTLFAATDVPETGMLMEFQDKGGGTLPGVVKSVTDSQVEVDFNHPLAGRAVIFEVLVVRVTPAGQTRIQLGRVG